MEQITQEIQAAIAQARPADIALRWRGFLAARYPALGRAKAIARAMGVPVKTATRWMEPDGPAPSAVNLMRAALIHGMAALNEVLLPGPATPPPSLDSVSRQLDALADLVRQVREATCPTRS